MSLFFLVFFFFYFWLHVYAFLKAKAALSFGTKAGIAPAIFMLAMVLAPVIVRYLERAGLEFYARVAAYIGYTWLGILFLFCSCSAVIDVYRFVVYLAGLILQKKLFNIYPSVQISFYVPLLLSLCISVYGYFEARDIRAEKVVIRSSKISKETGSLRVVQISDIHIGLIVREDRLKRILQKVKSLKPDILLSTGDLVDGQTCNLKDLAALFQEIKPGYGKFAITGNHEFYAGFEDARCFTEDAGFTYLRGEALTVGGVINIAGVDDPAGRISGLTKDVSEKELLAGLPHEKYTVLMKHRPFVDKKSIGLFDLQLSGHVHKGQIFPFSIITWLSYPVASGTANLIDNSYLYVSRGAGTWGPPIRFLAPPEVTLFELIHKD